MLTNHIILIIAVLSLNAPAMANLSSYATFAGVSFGLTHEQVRHLMALKGYIYDSTDSTGETFKGQIADTRSHIWTFYDNSNRLAKVVVNLYTTDNDAQNKYTEIHDQLISKYGTPNEDFNFYSDPYFAGDGYEQQAFKLGKATFLAYWPQPDGQSQLAVEITTHLIVKITYEGASWGAHVDAHKANASHDL
jgi:hypothetical protein